MQLVERHIKVNDKSLESLCFKAARLYNFCNYYRRMAHFHTLEKFSEYELSGLLAEFKQEDYCALPAQTSQQVIKLLFKNWKAYFAALKVYKKTPKSFTGHPKPPKYKDKKGFGTCVFTGQQIKLKAGFIHFPKAANIAPLKTKITEKIDQVRIVPQCSCFVIEVVYNVKPSIANVDKSKFLTLDLGVNNLAASVNNAGLRPFIINGKPLKSCNQFYNKTKAELMSYIGNKGTSNRIEKLTFKRNNYIEDKVHKASRFIVNYCIDNEIGTIIIGKNAGWKQESEMSKKTNQHFIGLPHAKLINKIKYKAELVGITVIETEEAYTSKCDHLAYEQMCHHENYFGRRKKRGLFQSSTGVLLNADTNGGIGISRKVFGDSAVKQIVDSGLAYNPVVINVL